MKMCDRCGDEYRDCYEEAANKRLLKDGAEAPKAHTVMVSTDGETWTHAHRCEVMVITPEGMARLMNGLKPRDLRKDEIFVEMEMYDFSVPF